MSVKSPLLRTGHRETTRGPADLPARRYPLPGRRPARPLDVSPAPCAQSCQWHPPDLKTRLHQSDYGTETTVPSVRVGAADANEMRYQAGQCVTPARRTRAQQKTKSCRIAVTSSTLA